MKTNVLFLIVGLLGGVILDRWVISGRPFVDDAMLSWQAHHPEIPKQDWPKVAKEALEYNTAPIEYRAYLLYDYPWLIDYPGIAPTAPLDKQAAEIYEVMKEHPELAKSMPPAKHVQPHSP
jgi:hypothetical protein